MEKALRTAISTAAQNIRRLLEAEYFEQLEGVFDIRQNGSIPLQPGPHLSARQRVEREKIVAAISYYEASGATTREAVQKYVREAAFTTLNRFVALKMLEARELIQQCVSAGPSSNGYREFVGLAPGVERLPGDDGYRLYLECVFDELSTDVRVLFDRQDAASVLWPRHNAFDGLLAELNAAALDSVWADDETIGWFYQFFNSKEERQRMRDESQAPRDSRELAVRNQFFTPRYVVELLVESTLGRLWHEMFPETILVGRCPYITIAQERPRTRVLRDPRDIRVLDPACGSGHFLLYAFDLLLEIYREAWGASLDSPDWSGQALCEDYSSREDLERSLPRLIIEHNLYGVDIDPRAAQIAALALWMRAQRAWRDAHVLPEDRPAIRRTGVVIAEPMSGDSSMVEEFASRLDSPLLGDLFVDIVQEMSLAGELGVLLQVERGVESQVRRAREHFARREGRPPALPGLEEECPVGEFDLSGIDEATFFEEAEARIVDSLRRFAETSSGTSGTRRRMFADDSAQGLALLEIDRTRFDVVLMNPPFGLIPRRSYNYLVATYPDAYYDLAVAFIARGVDLLKADGMCGAITTRAFMLVSDAERFRREIALPGMEYLVDLGSGVMDGAAVDASAQVLSREPEENLAIIDLRRKSDKQSALRQTVADPSAIQRVDRAAFQQLPGLRIAYDAVAPLAHMFSSDADGVEPMVAIARIGASTFDDERFLRARWEVGPADIGPTWMPSSRTAEEFSLYYYPPVMTVQWSEGGAEVCARNEQVNGQAAQARQGSSHYGKPGLVFARRSSPSIAFRAHPAGCSFASNTGVVLPFAESDIPLLLAFLNSSPARAAVNALSNRDSYTVGHIKKLKWPAIDAPSRDALASAGRRILSSRHRLFRIEETDPWFAPGEVFCSAPSCRGAYEAWKSWASAVADDLVADYAAIDEIVAGLLDVDALPAVRETFSLEIADVLQPTRLLEVSWEDWLTRCVSVAMGAVFGKWSSVGASDLSAARAEVAGPSGIPPAPPPSAATVGEAVPWLVDDPGHPLDVAARLDATWKALWPDDQGDLDGSMVQHLGRGLREWISRDFFAIHRRMYTSGKRVAPIYWQVGTPSGRFSVWLYLHDLTEDTLFRLATDYVEPRLAYEERKLADLHVELEHARSSGARAELDRQSGFVDELRQFTAELRRVAPIWAPFLDDGVPVNFGPLWRLVPQEKPWQKVLRKSWESLVAGEYDWAQLAMHLWPDRVVPKCAEDRSLAIAHGLEDIFWVRDDANSEKWHPRDTPTVAVDQLIADRTKPDTRAALEDAVR